MDLVVRPEIAQIKRLFDEGEVDNLKTPLSNRPFSSLFHVLMAEFLHEKLSLTFSLSAAMLTAYKLIQTDPR